MRVLVDRRMAAGDHCLLDIPPVDEQFGHSPAVAIVGSCGCQRSPHPVQVVLRCYGWGRLAFSPCSAGVSMQASRVFLRGGRIAVAAALDGHAG